MINCSLFSHLIWDSIQELDTVFCFFLFMVFWSGTSA